MRCHDHALALLGAGTHDPALDVGQFVEVHLHAQIAARHHDAVGFLHDLVQIAHAFLILDLGDDLHLAGFLAQELAQRAHIRRLARKGKRDVVHVVRYTEGDVVAVFFGDGWQVHADAGQVHVALAAERATVDHAAAHDAFLLAQHLEVDEPVVDRDAVAYINGLDDVGVVDLDRALFDVLGTTHGDGDFLAGAQVELGAHETCADLGPLRVEHDRHGVLHATVQLLHGADHAGVPLVVPVRHVEPHHIHAGVVELLQHLERAGGRADGADDLGLAHGAGAFRG